MKGCFNGGLYQPLSDADVKKIIDNALRLLEKTGVRVYYSKEAMEHFKIAGASVKSDGQTVLLPRTLVEDAVASAPSRIVLHGRTEENNIILEGSRVHYGTGGTAIYVIDL